MRTNRLLSYGALFASLGTLTCCALPALFVTLGFGSAFVALLTAVPQLVWLSEHKAAVFVLSGVMICAAALALRSAARTPCPVEGALAESCASANSAGRTALRCAIGAWVVGGAFAYLLPWVL